MSMSSKSWQRVSCKGAGSGRVRARVSRILAMLLGAEGLEGEAIGDGACNFIKGIDLGQRHDLADVVAGIEPLLLETFVIGLGIRRQCQEAQYQALFPGSHTLGEQGLGVLGILDVLVATIAALVAGDELGIEVDADAVGIGSSGGERIGRERNKCWCRT
jgi:hypothetical protein